MIRRPGPGWRIAIGRPCSPTVCGPPGDLIGGVYDHPSGLRIHAAGVLLLPDGELIYGETWPESQLLRHAIRTVGGNRKRGVMVWALRKMEERNGKA